MKHIAHLFLLKLLLALLLSSPADAQVCPTPASGANDSRCASTGFVQQELGHVTVTSVFVSTSTPTLTAGQLAIGGNTTVQPLANTDTAIMYLTPAQGLNLHGWGSTYDVTLRSNTDTIALGVPTGTQNVQVLGTLQTGNAGVASGQVALLGTTSGQANYLVSASGSHVNETSSGAAPTLTAGCNGAGSAVSSNGTGADIHGTITGQTAVATTCTLTFGNAYATAPDCQATGLNSALTSVTIAAATLVVTFASTANYKWTFRCEGT